MGGGETKDWTEVDYKLLGASLHYPLGTLSARPSAPTDLPDDGFQIRRTTEIRVESKSTLAINERIEFRLPPAEVLEAGDEVTLAGNQRLVTLGLYYATGPIPDLVATDSRGRALPILGRSTRSRLLARLVLSRFSHANLQNLPLSEDGSDCSFENFTGVDQLEAAPFNRVLAIVERAIYDATGETRCPSQVVDYYLQVLKADDVGAVTELAKAAPFVTGLRQAVERIHVVAAVEAVPGEWMTIQARHTEPMVNIKSDDDYRLTFAPTQIGIGRNFARQTPPAGFWQNSPTQWVLDNVARPVLRAVGLLPTALMWPEASMGHANSLHHIAYAPDGLEIEDMFWSGEHAWPTRPKNFPRGTRATLSTHTDHQSESIGGEVWIGLMIRRSAGLLAAAVASLFLALTSFIIEAGDLGTTSFPTTSAVLIVGAGGFLANSAKAVSSQATRRVAPVYVTLSWITAVATFTIAALAAIPALRQPEAMDTSTAEFAVAATRAIYLSFGLLTLGVLKLRSVPHWNSRGHVGESATPWSPADRTNRPAVQAKLHDERKRHYLVRDLLAGAWFVVVVAATTLLLFGLPPWW